MNSNKLLTPVNVLVRPHPKYDAYDSVIARKYPIFVLDRPGKYVSKTSLSSWEFENSDIIHLANTLYHTDVVINTSSTMGLESCIFDTPVINIAFDGYKKRNYWTSVRRFCNYNHYSNLIKTSGVRVARNKEELLSHINQYLSDPKLDREGRRKIMEGQLYRLNGQAGEGIGNFLLELLYQ